MLLGIKNSALQKDALYYSVFKERAEAIEKAPSLFQPKKQGGYNQVFYLLSAIETVPEIAVPVRLGIHGQNVGVACRLSERDLLPSPLSGK